VLPQPGEERIGHVDGCAAHADRVIEHEFVEVGEQLTGPIRRQRQQLRVAQAPSSRDLRAQIDAVLTIGQGGRLQFGQRPEALVDPLQLRCGLLELAVAAQQPRNAGVHLHRLDHAFRLAPGELRDLTAREPIGNLHPQPSFLRGDSCDAGHR
jgi:hypothetical protein